MPVVEVIEIMSNCNKSWEDAAKRGVQVAERHAQVLKKYRYRYKEEMMKLIVGVCFLCSILVAGSCHSKKPVKESTMIPVIERKSVQNDFKIFSESASKKIIIAFYSSESGKAMVCVYYTDGKLLQQKQLVVNKGNNTWDCYFSFNASGTYVVKFKMKNLERTGKIFKVIS